MMAGLGGAPHLEQWVTTTDELSAGGRYASLTKAQRAAAPSTHLPFQAMQAGA